ncbi:hypothetical protein KN825_16390, partial [Weizmannia coagulans]|nr:hypothetical protein [Heyndrickxia coagulans]
MIVQSQKHKNYNKGGGGSTNNKTMRDFPQCPYCKKTNHPQNKCWWRPDIKCHKCGELGHIEKICKSQQGEADIVTQQFEEECLFMTSYPANKSSFEHWLVDSDCSNHM